MKMTNRVRFICSLPIGLLSRIALNNMLAIPIARFYLTFLEPCEKVRLLQNRLMHKLSAGLYGWMHPEILLNMTYFIPNGLQPHDLRMEHTLAHLRTTLRHWDLIHMLQQQISAAAYQDMRILCGVFCGMESRTAIHTLCRVTHYGNQLRMCSASGKLHPKVV